MKVHRFQQQQTLAIPLEEAWAFFSDPRNLEQITPKEFTIRVLECPEGPVYAGEIISYRIKIAPLIWTGWVTEITAVENGVCFVDEQKSGPFGLWHHRHHFEETPEGVLMTDEVKYGVGFGIFGVIAHGLFVRRQVAHLFARRRELIAERFGVRAANAE